jgi:antitoxin VapB
MSVTAKLFMSGRSQAIRLPAALRMAAKEVQIEPMGGGLWIKPQPAPDQDMGVWLQNFYASTEALPDNFLATRQDVPAQTRDWSLD